MKFSTKVILLILIIVAIDQGTKIWVKTHMRLEQYFYIANDWAQIRFVENPGMAFSMELPGPYGKLLLSIFRFFAIGFIIYMIRKMIVEKNHKGLVYSTAIILAGAIGNLIDSAFYGLIFSDSTHSASKFLSNEGYAGFMQGYVVDMLYFPILKGYIPTWFPIWKGEYFEFFRPIFNVADAAVTVGVAIIILFQKSFFATQLPEVKETTNLSSEELNTSPPIS